MTVLDVLIDPISQELLNSNELARLAYTSSDGTPRVVPIWFHWTGTEVVLASPSAAPKLKVLRSRPDVALAIDRATWATMERIGITPPHATVLDFEARFPSAIANCSGPQPSRLRHSADAGPGPTVEHSDPCTTNCATKPSIGGTLVAHLPESGSVAPRCVPNAPGGLG